MTKILQPTMSFHFHVFIVSATYQLSYSHIKPMGWNDINVASNAPIKEMSPPKTGIALAMM